MLRLKALPEVLSQGLGGGVVGCQILNREGTLISSVDRDASRAKVIAAIVANLWEGYREQAASPPQLMLYQCAEGVVAVKAITDKLILCIYGDSVPAGMLKLKAETITQFLLPSLSQLAIDS